MKFVLKTLLDITETGARKGDDQFAYKQQQNFLTVLQTISLRANPKIKTSVVEEISVAGLGFGTAFKGKHKVWTLEFEFESDQQHNLEMLNNDFNYVPVIVDLLETAKFENAAFVTQGSKTANIIFAEKL